MTDTAVEGGAHGGGRGDSGTKVTTEGTPLAVDEAMVAEVQFDQRGLVAAVVQDAVAGDVLMVAYMDREALRRTLATGRTWFWSRSRQEYWQKGETSGDRQFVREVRVDCDGDALVVLVDQHGGGACHTGAWTCFFRSLGRGPGRPRSGGRARERVSEGSAGDPAGP